MPTMVLPDDDRPMPGSPRPSPRGTRAGGHGRFGRWACVWALALVWATPWAVVTAAPIKAAGQAKTSETNKPSPSRTRDRALRRARRSALQTALGRVQGPVDPAARKAVMKSAAAWTGAYRILGESSDAEGVRIEVEVEIDLVRLTKRVQRRTAGSGRPMFRLCDVGSAEHCGDPETISATVREELSARGGLVVDGKGESLDIALDCETLGPVRHTYLHAVRVRVVATSEGKTVAERVVPAFAVSPSEAIAAGLRRGLGEVAEALAAHRRGHLRLRVQSPLPAARIRRLESSMRNSVLGVDEVELAAIEPGLVELHVRGKIDLRTLARRLDELALPGFTVSIVKREPPDVLTIRLD